MAYIRTRRKGLCAQTGGMHQTHRESATLPVSICRILAVASSAPVTTLDRARSLGDTARLTGFSSGPPAIGDSG